MARITTRDCERVVGNRYELVLLAAELARSRRREKAPQSGRARASRIVTALRRIAAGAADPALRAGLVQRMRHMPLPGRAECGDRAPLLAAPPAEAQAA